MDRPIKSGDDEFGLFPVTDRRGLPADSRGVNMLANQDWTTLGFHESTLAGLSHRGGTVRLSLDGVRTPDGREAAEVVIEGVRDVLRDNSPTGSLYMEQPDGEVLTLRQDGDAVTLVVEWNDFAAKRQHVAVYTLVGGRIAEVG